MQTQDAGAYECPKCRVFLIKKESKLAKENITATLFCSKCITQYPVINGVLRFVPSDNYSTSFGYQWNLHRRTQLDSQTGFSFSKERLFSVTSWPEKTEGQLILEAGSGAGRFTEILCGTGAKIFSFDYSLAVEANFANNGHNENLNLFQGDIYNISLKKESFDKVICLRVLQHTPDPEEAFKSLTQYVKPGGELVVDVYARRITGLISWKYLLRPITKRLNKKLLYHIVSKTVSILLPAAILLRKIGGRIGSRLLPIVEFSYLGLPYELNKEWAILDTFDMYSPAHDHPQSLKTIEKWFKWQNFKILW